VARYADACNFIERGLGPEGLRRKCAILKDHCDRVGRDYEEIDKTVLSRVSLSRDGTGQARSGEPFSSVDQFVDRLGGLAEAGMDTAILGMGNDTDDAAYELVAEVVRQVEPLKAAGR
jgi:hypothetical protein